MPPKVKISKEDIINAAIGITRSKGTEAVNARSISAELRSSTQPIFSNFASMQELNAAVLERAREIYQENANREILAGKYPEYKAMGMSYIGFAKKERELFKLLFMRDRSQDNTDAEVELFNSAARGVQERLGISSDTAALFHLEIWTFVHGIASMIATNYLSLDDELISDMLTDVYQGLKTREEMKK